MQGVLCFSADTGKYFPLLIFGRCSILSPLYRLRQLVFSEDQLQAGMQDRSSAG